MDKFKVGDRVIFVNEKGHFFGEAGTVVDVVNENYSVDWDDIGNQEVFYSQEELGKF